MRQVMAERGTGERRLTAQVCRVVAAAALLMGVTLAGQAAGAETTARQSAIAPQPEARPSDTIGILDFYGLRTVTQPQARKALALQEGDRAPQSTAEITEAVRRLEKLPGVEHAG